ncbi:hypothetical protein C4D60_Mb10t15880 [Musa balbisiana]|uniref:Uncharacterized protein n=1 Tax=Musa balbisiana TaxID=52838 RepID=A0A4V4H4U6_MUSBA|nr:hypothetical protein C4D60_Mb10t15880 [Musa balbisiana]
MRNPSQSSAPGSSSTAAVEVEGRRRGGPTPCCSKVGLKRGPWTPEEDEVLASFVRREGEGRWRTLPKRAGLRRCGKSCRLRWMNYLRPSIKHGPIAPDEEDLILRLHRLLGNRWSLIAGRIPGRTDNEIKNYWNTHLSKKLISQGIDPRTHKPLSSSTPDAIQQPLAPRSYTNPNPSTVLSIDPSVLRAEGTHRRGIILQDNERSFSDRQNLQHDDDDDDEAWRNIELLDGATGNQEGGDYGTSEDGGIGIDCYTDDIFSSFLDSLINEDAFQQQHNVSNNDDNIILDNTINNNNSCNGNNQEMQPAGASTAPSGPVCGFGTFWEADFVGQIGLEEDVHEQFADHAGK